MISDEDRKHLLRCVDLAEEALEAGDEPFGSVLVRADGQVMAEARNRVRTLDDETEHPEFTLARWANRLPPEVRAEATVYTSGEHCPMCSAAHAWVGLGRIVYASSSEQLTGWLREIGFGPGRVSPLPIRDVVPYLTVDGPLPEAADRLKAMHTRLHLGL